MDSQNIASVFQSLVDWYDDERVYNFLRANYRTLVLNYYNQVNTDLLYSDPIIVDDGQHEIMLQVRCLNIAFKDYLDRLIRDMVLREGLRPGNTEWDDGFYASSKGPLYDCPRKRLADTNTNIMLHSYDSGRYSAQSGDRIRSTPSADDVLNSWWYPRRPIEVRDDAVGAIGQTADLRSRFPPQNTLTGAQPPYGIQYVRANAVRGPPGLADGKKNGISTPASKSNGGVSVPAGKSNGGVSAPASTPADKKDAPARVEKYTVQNPSYMLHNSPPLTAAAINIPADYCYADPSDGAFYEIPKQEYVEVDRLLNTPLIQSLNTGGQCRAVDNKGRRYPMACAPVATEQPENNVKLWQDTNGVVDESDPAVFAHYMNRRIFRSYNRVKNNYPQGDSAEDQIPFYERALYNRYYDRDVEENIGGFEYDNIVRKHSMSSLKCRVEKQKEQNWRTECVNTAWRNV